jgi:hypothetical protein
MAMLEATTAASCKDLDLPAVGRVKKRGHNCGRHRAYDVNLPHKVEG